MSHGYCHAEDSCSVILPFHKHGDIGKKALIDPWGHDCLKTGAKSVGGILAALTAAGDPYFLSHGVQFRSYGLCHPRLPTDIISFAQETDLLEAVEADKKRGVRRVENLRPLRHAGNRAAREFQKDGRHVPLTTRMLIEFRLLDGENQTGKLRLSSS